MKGMKTVIVRMVSMSRKAPKKLYWVKAVKSVKVGDCVTFRYKNGDVIAWRTVGLQTTDGVVMGLWSPKGCLRVLDGVV